MHDHAQHVSNRSRIPTARPDCEERRIHNHDVACHKHRAFERFSFEHVPSGEGSNNVTSDRSAWNKLHIRGKRDAVRILFVIAKAGEPVKKTAPKGTCLVINAEKKLQALDFWMRNPDYLASEILNLYEADTSQKQLLKMADKVMSGDEPDIRRLAMQRFLFGAWEALDDAIATLSLPGLVKMQRSFTADGKKIRQTSYFLTDEGAAKAAELEKVKPLDWYASRAEIVATVAGTRSGSQLKSVQYKVAEYNDARHGTLIAPIREEVADRLKELKVAA